MAKYVLAIDQGTTGTTVMIIDEAINIVGRSNQEFEQRYPKPGWVEHDPQAIWQSTTRAIGGALAEAKIDVKAIAAIGITNQRETSLIWERASGRPVHHAIVWQDRRTADLCQSLRAAGHSERVRKKTGLVLDPYFSGTKVHWLLKNLDGIAARARQGELAFGTIDSYLVYRLSGGQAHITDVSNASRTLLYNISQQAWDDELLSLLEIPAELLPEVKSCSEVYATTRGMDGLPDGIPIAGIAGDQQAALFGQACFAPGDAKCTYGTGAFLLVNTGNQPVFGESGVLTTIAWRLGTQPTVYAQEGSAFIAGAAVQWLRDGLKLIERAEQIEALAASVDDSAGVVFVPALAGLGAPHWRADARGIICGLTRGVNAAHLARATLEGIALQICDLTEAMHRDCNIPIGTFRVDGGAAANNLLMQLQSDLLDKEVVRPQVIETTALGAAFLAGLATGVWPDESAIRATWRPERRFSPQMKAETRRELRERWATAVARA
ncbi:MAG: glycerol kinase GlpK [Deltaproteobacteria bacterium]|nr:glycerol kinase GlpK [Deltaproteobacteria bacterium]